MTNDEFIPLRGEHFRENAIVYGRHPNSPANIHPIDIEAWKAQVAPTFQHYLHTKYNDLVERYHALIKEYELNRMLYESCHAFTPVIGYTYYLYQRPSGERFLSLVEPEFAFWGGYVGSYRLTTQYGWEETP